MKIENDNLFIEKPHADNYECKDLEKNNENVLRVYCQQYPDTFLFQIRTHKGINGPFKPGKSRNMIADCSLTIAEVEKILEFMRLHSVKAIRNEGGIDD